jgi:hypothetical protein
MQDSLSGLTAEKIAAELATKWPMLQALFPRTINSMQDRQVSLHTAADMRWQDYNIERLLQKSAAIIIEQDWLTEYLMQQANDLNSLSAIDLMQELAAQGLSYLWKYYPDQFAAALIQLFGVDGEQAQHWIELMDYDDPLPVAEP